MLILWYFDIEPHEQRYTCEWKEYLPNQLYDGSYDNESQKTIEVISGQETSGATNDRAFLNFTESSVYKATQIARFAKWCEKGVVTDGDRVLFADAWHPGVIQCRYLADLLGLDLSIDVMWHAGSYDPWDLLGRRVSNKAWSHGFERSIFDASDRNYFATEFHRDLFLKTLKTGQPETAEVVGWPMEYLVRLLGARAHGVKKDTILFPHRLSPEKQPEIMELLEPHFPEYRVVYAQKEKLTKQQYHDELARSVAVFSANLQETLGIAMYEGLLCGAVPIVPDRLSYSEIYPGQCYPSEWTETLDAAKQNVDNMVAFIRNRIANDTPQSLVQQARWAGRDFFDGRALYESVFR